LRSQPRPQLRECTVNATQLGACASAICLSLSLSLSLSRIPSLSLSLSLRLSVQVEVRGVFYTSEVIGISRMSPRIE